MAAEEWSTRYRPLDPSGHTVPLESLPLGVAMLKRELAYGILTISGADGVDLAGEDLGEPQLDPWSENIAL